LSRPLTAADVLLVAAAWLVGERYAEREQRRPARTRWGRRARRDRLRQWDWTLGELIPGHMARGMRLPTVANLVRTFLGSAGELETLDR
jgi:hypothetical protein